MTRPPWSRIVLAVLSGIGFALADDLHPYALAAWLAPLPVLVASLRGTRRQAFAFGALAGAIQGFGLARYLAALAGFPIAALVIGLDAVVMGIAVGATTAVYRRWGPHAAAFAFPAALAALDLASSTGPHGSAGSLAYSQLGFLPAAQVAALGGNPAIVALVTLLASTAAVAWTLATTPRAGTNPFAVVPLPAALVVGAIWWGATRPILEGGYSVPVGLLATDGSSGVLASGSGSSGLPDDWDAVWTAYRAQIDQVIADGARIVVLPEELAEVADEDRVRADLTSVGPEALLVAGVRVSDQAQSHNRALVVHSHEVVPYDKQHLVPGLEAGITAGSQPLVLGGGLGVAICKDLDFALLGRTYAMSGVGLMLVPAWDFRGDWGEDGWLHGRMAVLRGVEDGFAVARSARTGHLTLSDRYGRVSEEAVTGEGMARVLGTVRVVKAPTPFARFGDVFGGTCAVLVGLALLVEVGAAVRNRRQGRGPQESTSSAKLLR